jgi:hypothetical protein
MQNPAISFSDLPSIDALHLITGGEGWGQWIGKYGTRRGRCVRS